MKLNAYLFALQLVAALLTSQAGHAEYALFDQNTDTIAVSGDTILGTSATFEAIISLDNGAGGTVFHEQISGLEHKALTISSTQLLGFAYTPANISGFGVSASISLNDFHHVAFVRDGSQERLYLDGSLLASKTVSGDIGDAIQAGHHPAAIGASQFDVNNIPSPSFLGLLDTFRISNVARYTGSSYTAPTGDLTSDVNTLLLYNFNIAEVSGGNITDLSNNGRHGTFASGFIGATSPTITGLTILPGLTPDNPIMPIAQTPGGGFRFGFPVVAGQRRSMDPLVAVGYDYLINSGPNVASVFLPAIGDDLFDLFLWNGADWIFSQVLSAETEFFFGGGGVDRFRILGIETSAGLDPNSSTAFVTGLTFAGTGTVNMDMNPITQETPEPSALFLFAVGLPFLGLRRRVS